MTANERMKAMRERMKAQGLVARTVYFPKDDPPPTQEEVSAFLAWRKANPQAVTVTPRKTAPSVTVTPPIEPAPVTVTPQSATPAAPVGAGLVPAHCSRQEAPQPAHLVQPNRKQWNDQAKAERDRETKQEIKLRAMELDHSSETSRTEGLCTAAAAFLETAGLDAIKDFLKQQGVTHNQAEAALYPDHRRRTSTILVKLEDAGIWDNP